MCPSESNGCLACNVSSGNYYKDHNNNTAARMYYERAAELGSPEGHFSYAMMLREGVGGPINVPLAVVHLCVAASRNHIRCVL
jgi:TPR repeat protein